MVKDPAEQRLFRTKGIEMRWLVGRVEVSRPRVLAIKLFVSNQSLQRRDGLQRRVEHRACAGFAEPGDECFRVELQAGQHLPAIAGTGARSDTVAVEYHHRRSAAGKSERGGQAGI